MVRKLTHVKADGSLAMLDVGAKPTTSRVAVAEATIEMSAATMRALKGRGLKKGDAFAAAQLAGIGAAKRTAELIPLAHPLPLTHIDVRCSIEDATHVRIVCSARVNGQTGVEMEALTGAAVAALTIYDMCKALDRAMTISGLRLVLKTGGKSGSYRAKRR